MLKVKGLTAKVKNTSLHIPYYVTVMQISKRLQVTTLPVSPCERCHIVTVRVYFYPQRCSSIVPSENDCFSSVIVSQLTEENNTPASPPPEKNT